MIAWDYEPATQRSPSPMLEFAYRKKVRVEGVILTNAAGWRLFGYAWAKWKCRDFSTGNQPHPMNMSCRIYADGDYLQLQRFTVVCFLSSR